MQGRDSETVRVVLGEHPDTQHHKDKGDGTGLQEKTRHSSAPSASTVSLSNSWESTHQRIYTSSECSRRTVWRKLHVGFYRAIIESILTYCILVWYADCTAAGKRVLERIIKTPAPSSRPSTSRYLSRVQNIIKDPSYPGHHLFELLSSGRRYRAAKSQRQFLSNCHQHVI